MLSWGAERCFEKLEEWQCGWQCWWQWEWEWRMLTGALRVGEGEGEG